MTAARFPSRIPAAMVILLDYLAQGFLATQVNTRHADGALQQPWVCMKKRGHRYVMPHRPSADTVTDALAIGLVVCTESGMMREVDITPFGRGVLEHSVRSDIDRAVQEVFGELTIMLERASHVVLTSAGMLKTREYDLPPATYTYALLQVISLRDALVSAQAVFADLRVALDDCSVGAGA